MAEQLHKDYYRKFDTKCESLGKRINDFKANDKKFLDKVQQLRNKRIEQGYNEHGSRAHYSDPFMFGVIIKRCKACCKKYSETSNRVHLFDALNYLMFEYLNNIDKSRSVDDEYDVLNMFYHITWEECNDDVYQFVLTALHIYTNFNELEYLQIAALAIYDELYSRGLEN